ncbi:hypothetical protein BDV25DRAFT_110509 [Aspergillus avenaceus]|uniref:HotDog domain-containing protein n=1 Tax=Aspergillus avenaceus TaxID=36643 RepID=A0A5N6TWB2_ASPAV|nr:hypothetical protein BDV25DRAFT_110509 [Aspergillus avenaceus]
MTLSPKAQRSMRLYPSFVRRGCSAMRRFSVYHAQRSASEPLASGIAASFLSRFQSLGPQTRTQLLDANQLQLLSLTLNRPSLFSDSPSLSNTSGSVPDGTPLPPGYHLVYFTPAFLENELGADGTDVSYNPETPFTRRMWAGGEVHWPRGVNGNPNPLRVGQKVQETTKVLSAQPKTVRKTGEEMIVVGVEKEFRNEHGVAVIDRRNWVFRKALSAPSTPHASNDAPVPSAPAFSSTASVARTYTRTLRQTAVTLFRFSALTFNPHKIHYSTPWAQKIEGHKDIVVHGPLNLISILDLWRDTRSTQGSDPALMLPENISYRATSPLFAEDEYRVVLDEEGDGVGRVQIFDPKGTVAMKAEIKSAD